MKRELVSLLALRMGDRAERSVLHDIDIIPKTVCQNVLKTQLSEAAKFRYLFVFRSCSLSKGSKYLYVQSGGFKAKPSALKNWRGRMPKPQPSTAGGHTHWGRPLRQEAANSILVGFWFNWDSENNAGDFKRSRILLPLTPHDWLNFVTALHGEVRWRSRQLAGSEFGFTRWGFQVFGRNGYASRNRKQTQLFLCSVTYEALSNQRLF